jgi:hypothetical protein
MRPFMPSLRACTPACFRMGIEERGMPGTSRVETTPGVGIPSRAACVHNVW